MKNIDIESLLKYTKELTLLYAEDDLKLQETTKALFETLFKSVTVVDDGKEALKEYEKNTYDLVVSDVEMPNMNGLELIENIKNITYNQPVVIISAYSDSQNLVKFINLNVSNFLSKPIKLDNLLYTLYTISKSIINSRVVEEYRKELEEMNNTLKNQNQELQSLVRILDSKISKAPQSNTDTNYEDSMINLEHLKELQELEIDISGASVLISLSKHIEITNIEVLGEMFSAYTEVVSCYPKYNVLAKEMNLLALILKNAPENFIKRVDDISILLESFIYVLRMWRKHLLANEVQKAFSLHNSIVNDIRTIISIIDGTQSQIETEVEFF